LFEPDLGLLFGKGGSGGEENGHSPLSASWSTVLPESPSGEQVPAEDERITCSMSPFWGEVDGSLVGTVVYLCSTRR